MAARERGKRGQSERPCSPAGDKSQPPDSSRRSCVLSYMGYVGRVLLYMMYLSVAFNLHGVGPAVEGFCSSRRWASSRGGDKNKPPGKPRVAATSPGHMHVGGWWAWVDAVAALRFERAVGAFSVIRGVHKHRVAAAWCRYVLRV